jgi:hypothetical protein
MNLSRQDNASRYRLTGTASVLFECIVREHDRATSLEAVRSTFEVAALGPQKSLSSTEVIEGIPS